MMIIAATLGPFGGCASAKKPGAVGDRNHYIQSQHSEVLMDVEGRLCKMSGLEFELLDIGIVETVTIAPGVLSKPA